jgi:coproporphyrinogen III oxidase
MPNSSIRSGMIEFLQNLQLNIVESFEKLDPTTKFRRDTTDHGVLYIIQDSPLFEKAGLTHSIVKGQLSENRIKQLKGRGWKLEEGTVYNFFTTGLSLIFHAKNPFVPTIHFNYRYFEVTSKDDDTPIAWWFGGGTDLTPIYVIEEDSIHFHNSLKSACDKYDASYYPKFKKWCDEYFYISHRGEHRGVGGIFFDDLTSTEEEGGAAKIFEFVKSCASAFIEGYLPIVEKRKDTPFTETHTNWQRVRRGRYVEFNLVYDRGTHFGLQTPGIRAENILISMPLNATWLYDHQVDPQLHSEEYKTLEIVKTTRDWATI